MDLFLSKCLVAYANDSQWDDKAAKSMVGDISSCRRKESRISALCRQALTDCKPRTARVASIKKDTGDQKWMATGCFNEKDIG
jgi:hypothetical protein